MGREMQKYYLDVFCQFFVLVSKSHTNWSSHLQIYKSQIVIYILRLRYIDHTFVIYISHLLFVIYK